MNWDFFSKYKKRQRLLSINEKKTYLSYVHTNIEYISKEHQANISH